MIYNKPRLLILSHIFPFFIKSGQQQRVYYTLKAIRRFFNVTFLAPVYTKNMQEIKEKMLTLCDDVILFPSRYFQTKITKIWHKMIGTFYRLNTGLKLSNYIIGELDFAPEHVESLLKNINFDCILFEYWHAVKCVSVFHKRGIPCILDMHDIQWQTYSQYLTYKSYIPKFLKNQFFSKYKKQEEEAWQQFDAIIAINLLDYEYVYSKVKSNIKVFYLPMGTDLKLWSYSWQPTDSPIIGYYGGLGGIQNQRASVICYKEIMPIIWNKYPNAELWFIGSNPPSFLFKLSKKDSRVKVTGYIERVWEVLKKIWVIVCPFIGTYGFRSRLVEVMALGIPVVASPDAVYGMGMEINKGVFIEKSSERMAEVCLHLLSDREFAKKQSQLARLQIEEKFSFEATYERFSKELFEFVIEFNKHKNILYEKN